MGDYYCPNCNADLEDQYGFDPSRGTWTCTCCGQFLMDSDIADGDTYEGVAWFCDNCNALLNRQSGFSDSYGTWTCTECGHTNGITDEDIIEDKHKCPNCGSNLKKQWGYSEYSYDYTCSECDSLLHRDYYDNEFSVVEDKDKCPNCGAYLKTQSGFSDYDDDWKCSECYADLHRDYSSDPFSVVTDEHKCPHCGAVLLKQSGYSEYCYDWTCTECDSELHRDYGGNEFSVVDNDDSNDDDDIDDGDNDNETYNRSRYGRYSPPPTQSYERRSSRFTGGYTSQPRYSEDNSGSEPMLSKSDVRKKRMKAFFLKKKLIKIGVSSYALRGKSVDEVYAILHNCGFKYIKKVEVKDIYVNSRFSDNEIGKIEINGRSSFEASSEFPYDASVVITIHKKKEITIPFSAVSQRRLDYKDVCSRLSSLGFTEVHTSPIKDLVTGWLTKDGSVEKIVVNGSNSFRKNSVFKFDEIITVYYHTFNK